MSQSPELAGHCPVGYVAAGEALKGDPEFAVTYKGKVYHLLNAEAKIAFEENPEKFIPAFDGKCAFGMSIGQEFEACPNHFKMIDGKPHFFLKNEETDAMELWDQQGEQESLAKANEHWTSCHSTCSN